MWIDTHCHLDAHEFGEESLAPAARAQERGVGMVVIPAVDRANFAVVRELAHRALMPATGWASIRSMCRMR